MKGGTLKQASKLYRSRKYSELIRLLEPQIFRFRDSFSFYYYLGISCLHTGDFGGAYSYLSRATDLKRDDVDTLNALASIHLKRRETEDALRFWLKTLEVDPSNRTAKSGLDFLKKGTTPEELYNLVDTGAYKKFFPAPSPVHRLVPWIVTAVILIPSLLVGGVYLFRYISERSASSRPGSEVLEIPGNMELTEYSGSYRYILTDKEVTETIGRIDKYFAAQRDNLVMKEINFLLGSNAAPELKEKMRNLSSYLSVPTFTTIRDSFSYTEVNGDPYLFNGCYVVWKGRASNIVITAEEITFDFLVGYHENKVLEGIVRVELDFAAHIIQNLPVEILGRIHTDGHSVLLEGLSIHQLEP